jgi:hypothetical protein
MRLRDHFAGVIAAARHYFVAGYKFLIAERQIDSAPVLEDL